MSFNIMSLFVDQPASDNKESNTVSVPVQTISSTINSVPANVSEQANVPENFNV